MSRSSAELVQSTSQTVDQPSPLETAVARALAELSAAVALNRDTLASVSVDRTALSAQLAQAEASLADAPPRSPHHRMVVAAVELLRVRLQSADHVAEIASRALADCETVRGTLATAVPRDVGVGDDYTPPAVGGSRQVFQVVEDERMRIARDMHDGPAQLLANLVLKAEIVERFLEHDPSMVRTELADFKAIVRIALEETRRLIFDLRPMTLDDLGLVPTILRFAADFEQRWNIPVRVQVLGTERRIEGERESAIFRIVQESINNARKHAIPSLIEITISLSAKRITVTVKDDGRGFDVSATEQDGTRAHHLGLTSMRERAALVGAVLDISSGEGRGTQVRVSLTT